MLFSRFSDMAPMDADNVTLQYGVENDGGWVMHSHPTMSKGNKARERAYVCFPGN